MRDGPRFKGKRSSRQNSMLQESHTHEDCAAVLFTFARVDDGHPRSGL